MTQEDKELLLKDLCARQVYDVKCRVFNNANPYTLSGVLHNKPYNQLYFEELDYKEFDGFVSINDCKPYLFPLSSMTEEQKEEYCLLQDKIIYNGGRVVNEDVIEYLNWCYKNHLDINNLIPKGFANDATGLNIY